MHKVAGWKKYKGAMRVAGYGVQKGWVRTFSEKSSKNRGAGYGAKAGYGSKVADTLHFR